MGRASNRKWERRALRFLTAKSATMRARFRWHCTKFHRAVARLTKRYTITRNGGLLRREA